MRVHVRSAERVRDRSSRYGWSSGVQARAPVAAATRTASVQGRPRCTRQPRLSTKPETSPERQAFYDRLDQNDTAPLWEVLSRLVLPEPKPAIVPALWKYDDVRPLLMEAGRLLTAQEAERRVLVLENPGLRGASQITQSLYAGLQLILPGEVAPSHRHAASALRFVVEGDGGGYTAVDGERTSMRTGDFVLTPSWTFHDHGNLGVGAGDLDGRARRADRQHVRHELCRAPSGGDAADQPRGRGRARALRRQPAAGRLHAVEPVVADLQLSVLAQPRGARAAVAKRRDRSRVTASRCSTSIPATGGYPLPTIGAFLQLLPKGFAGKAYRSTDATIYRVVEGRGRSRVGSQTFDVGSARHLRRAVVAAGVARGERGSGPLQRLRSRRAEGARPLARRDQRSGLGSTDGECGAKLSYRSDRPELQHDDGDGDPRDAARARGRRARAVHVSFEPHADEEGDEGGAGGDGRRLRSMRRRALRRARGRHRLRLPGRDHEHGPGLSLRSRRSGSRR